MMTEKSSRPWWRLGLRIWTGLLLLLVLNVAFLAGAITPYRIAWIVNCLDPRLWPAWIAYLIWGITLWVAVDLPKWPESAIGLKQIVKPVLILLLIGLICYLNGWHAPKMRQIIYRQYYFPIIVGTWSNFMLDGKLDWKLLIVPTFALVAFVYLFRLLIQLRKKKKHNENESDRT